MVIGVISDTHIPVRATALPAEVIRDLKKVDMIVHAGDLVEKNVLVVLRQICPKVVAVCGNMDSEELKSILKTRELIKIENFKIGVIHGYGPPSELINLVASEFERERPDVIIFGHSHSPYNQRHSGVLLFNPGSLTDKVFSSFNSYGLLEIKDKITAKIVKLKG